MSVSVAERPVDATSPPVDAPVSPTDPTYPQRIAELRATSGCGSSADRTFRRRMRVWRRDNFHCQYCGCDLLADVNALMLATIDHLRPRAAGGTNEQANLVSACWTCNQFKRQTHTATVSEARMLVSERRAAFSAYRTEVLALFGVDFPRMPSVGATEADAALLASMLAGPAAMLHRALEIVELLQERNNGNGNGRIAA